MPTSTIAWIKARRIDVVVKFALDLLRVPGPDELAVPILSYHHVDPARSVAGRQAFKNWTRAST